MSNSEHIKADDDDDIGVRFYWIVEKLKIIFK